MSRLYKDFFNQDMIDYFKNYKNKNEPHIIEVMNGRALTAFVDLPEYINQYLLSRVSEYVGDEVFSSSSSLCVYSSRYGTPKLEPHTDTGVTEFVIDYQLESNTEWPLYLNGEEVVLKDNEALLFSAQDICHWRKRRDFKEGEELTMLFFYFVNKNHWSRTGEDNLYKTEKWSKRSQSIIDKYIHMY